MAGIGFALQDSQGMGSLESWASGTKFLSVTLKEKITKPEHVARFEFAKPKIMGDAESFWLSKLFIPIISNSGSDRMRTRFATGILPTN